MAKKIKQTEQKGSNSKIARANYTFPQEFYDLNKKSSNNNGHKFIPYPEIKFEDKIILIPKFFDNKLCTAITKSLGDSSDQDYKHMESFIQRGNKEYAARFNDRFQATDEEIANQVLWPYLKEVLEQDEYIMENADFKNAQGLYSNLRCYRYVKGHHFGKHYDASVDIPKTKYSTKWTLLIYLTGGDQLVGGDTIFYSSYDVNNALSVHPEQGMALLHKHGDDCLLHEAEMVSKGVKWVFRSDVYF